MKAVTLPPGPTAIILTWACTRPVIPRTVRGPPVAFLAAALLTNLRLLCPSAAVFSKLLDVGPVAISLLLLQPPSAWVEEGSVRELRELMIAFIIGAVGTTIGAVVAGFIVPAHHKAVWQMASAFAATYIGGSVNYVGVARALNIPDDLAAAGLAADLAAMGLYFTGLFYLASRLRPEYRAHASSNEETPQTQKRCRYTELVPLLLVPMLLTASMAIVSSKLAGYFSLPPGSNLMIMSFTSVLVSRSKRLQPYLRLSASTSDILVTAFFVALGVTARLSTVVGASVMVVRIVSIVLVIHALVMFVVGRGLFRLPMKLLLLASNANIGGATTAAAFAAACGWRELVAMAIFVGTCGYLAGTPVGLLLFHVFTRSQLGN